MIDGDVIHDDVIVGDMIDGDVIHDDAIDGDVIDVFYCLFVVVGSPTLSAPAIRAHDPSNSSCVHPQTSKNTEMEVAAISQNQFT